MTTTANQETNSAILLFSAVIFAIVISNSPLAGLYNHILNTAFIVQIGNIQIADTLTFWINDGLMTVFFLLIGLVIKRELFRGVLQKADQIILPVVGAVGGLLVPIFIYTLFNWHHPIALHGWAIPAATDIAFSLGILALLGPRIPLTLKIFLTALAIVDDIEAILIIAIFYATELSFVSLSFATFFALVLLIINKMGFKQRSLYYFIGFLLWAAMLESGIHATIAGIILAFSIPLEEHQHTGLSPLITTERALAPWVNYLVLPVFAFANTGIAFSGLTFSNFFNSITVGIILGLFIGKQLGIFSICWLLIKFRLAKLPDGVSLSQLYGVAIICGVGFTMSLFIGALAFEHYSEEYTRLIRTGVLAGSALSGLTGYLFSRYCAKKTKDH